MTKSTLWTAAAAILGAGEAFAQTVSDGYAVPPIVPSIDWWTILYFVVASVGVAVVSFKSARRTHLD